MWEKNLITFTCSTIQHSFHFEIDLLVTYHYRRACFMFRPVDFDFLSTSFTTSFSGNNFRHFQVVLKTVIFVFPISIIVIKVGDVFLLPYSNISTQHYEIENEMFRLLSFKFLSMILWQEGALWPTKQQFKIIIGWIRKIIMIYIS